MADDLNVVGLSGNKKGKVNWKVVSAIVGIIVLAVGVVAGIILVRQSQDIREKAACVAACPASNGNLINCYNTSDPDGEESICNAAGRIEICGQNASDAKEYCCPTAGGSWTTNMTLCRVATPTATATATSTTKSSSTPTATSTTKSSSTPTATSTTKSSSTPKATATASSAPVPVTGSNWTTIFGAGAGVIMILLALGLAL